MKRTSLLISRFMNNAFKKIALATLVVLVLKPDMNYAQIFTKLSSPTYNTPSAGCAWIDYNNDGKLDGYLSNFSVNCRLYTYRDSEVFELINSGDMIPAGSNFSGMAWGDYNNDGKADLYITSMSGSNALFKNLGDGHFKRITNSATTKDGGSFLSCNWIDYNNDGYLDLFVTASGTSFAPGTGNHNLLYKNNGDETFTKITDVAITAQKTLSSSAGFADIDNDGDQDVFLTEWNKDNWLFENNGDGTFSNISGTEVNANKNISITCSWGDYDNDGYLDLFVGNGVAFDQNLKQKNYLFHNNGNKTFTKITTGEIAEYSGCVWTSAWGDVDNDGDLDLYAGTIYEKEVLLYINNGDGTFTTKHEFGTSTLQNGTSVTGASFGDYDNDGFIDLLIANANNEVNPFIYRNNGNSNNWLSIKCTGTMSNNSAIGARVKVKAKIFGKTFWQTREIHGVNGFRGSDDLRVHFGLGDATTVDSLVILWPSKQLTVQENIPVNQFLNIKETVRTGYLRPNFKVDKLSGFSPLQIKFTDCSLSDDEQPITSWSWDFNGDGIEDSNEKDPVFVFDVYAGQTFPISLTISNGHKSVTLTRENYISVTPMFKQNVALKQTVTASSVKTSTYPASNAVDGVATTRWLSAVSDTEWIQVEMDSIYSIGKVVLRWASNYARQYKIMGSRDNIEWFELLYVDDGRGSTDTCIFNSVRAKYLKIEMMNSSNNYGFAIYEMEIYRPEVTDVESENILPEKFNLSQNYPNPFNPSTTIRYQIPVGDALSYAEVHVSLIVYDILGREISTLVNEQKSPGNYKVEFNGNGLPTGIYFYQLRVDNLIETKKMLLMK